MYYVHQALSLSDEALFSMCLGIEILLKLYLPNFEFAPDVTCSHKVMNEE